MKRYFKTTFFLLLILLALSGCGQTAEEQLAVQATMQSYTRTAQAPTPMPPALEFAVAVEQAKSTMAAVEATQVWIYGQLTATQVAREEIWTQQAAAVTAQAFGVQSTATHEAFVAHQMATQRSFEVTSTAQFSGSATAYPMTAQAYVTHAVQTERAYVATQEMAIPIDTAQAAAAYGNAESVELAVQRERSTNMTRAWLPWMAFAVVIGLIVVMGIRWSRVRVVQKDAFGSSPLLLIDSTAMDVDSSTSFRITKDGSAEWSQGNERMTENKQKVDLARALPAGKPELPQMLTDMPRRTPQIEVLDDGKLNRAMLDEIEDQIIEEE